MPAFLHLYAIQCRSNPSIQNTLLRLSIVMKYVTNYIFGHVLYSVTKYVLKVSFPTLSMGLIKLFEDVGYLGNIAIVSTFYSKSFLGWRHT